MKRIILIPLFLCSLLHLNTNTISAQEVVHHVKVLVNDGSVDWEMDGQVANFGPSDFGSLTGNLAWVTDGVTVATDGDMWSDVGQYGCDSLINGSEIDGNIAFISRGACEFGQKILNAENQGAIAGIIGNRAPIGLAIGTHNNELIWMGGGVVGDQVTIPSIFLNYEDRAVLADLMAAGPVEITIEHTYMYDAAAAYQYATPLNQVRPLENIQLALTNWDTTDLYNVTVNCTLTSPSGVETVLTEVIDTLQNAVGMAVELALNISGEVLVTFDEGYTPTEMGTYTAVFTAATESGTHGLDSETKESTFVISENTFMMDNDNIVNEDGFALNPVSFFGSPGVEGIFGMGNFFRTGADGTVVSASFAIANPSEMTDIIFEAKLYNADSNGDGTLDNDDSGAVNADDIPESALITFGSYTMTGSEAANGLITIDFAIPGPVSANSTYLMLVEANGSSGFSPPAFTTAGGENYPDFASAYRAGLDFDADGLEDWNDATTTVTSFPHGGRHPVIRMNMDGFVSTNDSELGSDKYKVFPTATNGVVNLELDLDKISDVVKIKITDINGKLLDAKVIQNAQRELLQFDVSHFTAGTYYFNIETREGFASQAFMKF